MNWNARNTGRVIPMTSKSIALTCFSLMVGAGLVAILVADEVRKAAHHDRWLQHDISRPRPPVVEPVGGPPAAPAPAPNDAVILFDGTNLDAWRAPGGRPARWRVSSGVMEVAPGTGAIETKGNSATFNCTSSGPRPNRPPARDRIAATAEFFSWACLRFKSSTRIRPIPTPTVRPGHSMASIRRLRTHRGRRASGRRTTSPFAALGSTQPAS